MSWIASVTAVSGAVMSATKQRRENTMYVKEAWLDSVLTTGRRAWLDEPIFRIGTYELTRRQIATVTEVPSTRAAMLLRLLCEHQGITTMTQLYNLGLEGLLSYEGTGEAQAWVAVCALADNGFDVNAWIPPTRTTRGAIAAAKVR